MRVFVAGIMQGSQPGTAIESQVYRNDITEMLKAWRPDVEVVDPFVLYPDSVDYDMEKAKRTFTAILDRIPSCDALIAYMPRASMGTALEMQRAHAHGIPVISVTPLEENWAVQLLSARILPDLESLEVFINADGLINDL